ncbi:MAG TPA: TdeIII family type II restriction endonuclease, partial [Clostridiales bacterium]|nr:TdeIII family type II restriction endonuclease [Clostridiales bacterium]
RAFDDKFTDLNTNIDSLINMSSWMHGLNTTLGQSFFENVAHILSCGEKKTFKNNRIYTAQSNVIFNIMTDLKNNTYTPSVAREESLIAAAAHGEISNAPDFTADCFFEDEHQVVAIELKSVRPNSGEMRGEKQKILSSKTVLKSLYPSKEIHYYFGFPFDPLSETDTGHNKTDFMNSIIELNKFCAPEEILIADELWSYLSGEEGSMQDILNTIRDISSATFNNDLNLLCALHSITDSKTQYREIVTKWHIIDELDILDNWEIISAATRRDIVKYRNACIFNNDGKYNQNRANTLLSYISRQ